MSASGKRWLQPLPVAWDGALSPPRLHLTQGPAGEFRVLRATAQGAKEPRSPVTSGKSPGHSANCTFPEMR